MSFRALNIGQTGLTTQSDALGVTANNLANLQTPGFKSSRADFQNLLTSYLGGGNGVGLAATQLDLGGGPFQATGRPLDLAISGNGFFQVTDGNGNPFYTRTGNFTTDATGTLGIATSSGAFTVQPPITVPADAESVSVASNGTVTANVGGQNVELGQLTAAGFPNPGGLTQVGDNLFAESGASGDPILGTFGADGFGLLQQGGLEGSNVDLTSEIVQLVQTQQAFSLQAEVVRAASRELEVLQTLND